MPKLKILGTQSPMKMAWSAFPLKNNISEYIKESNAEMMSNLSVRVNFLNIIINNFLSYLLGFSEYAPFFSVVLASTLNICYLSLVNERHKCKVTIYSSTANALLFFLI